MREKGVESSHGFVQGPPKQLRAKVAQPLQQQQLNLDPNNFSMKQVSQRYSSQMAQENQKKIQNSAITMHQKTGKYVLKENFQVNNCSIQKNCGLGKSRKECKGQASHSNLHSDAQIKFGTGQDQESDGGTYDKDSCYSHPLNGIPTIHLNQRQSLDVNKNYNLKFFNNVNQSAGAWACAQSQSPKPQSAQRESDKQAYERLLMSQHAFEAFNQVENNRNSQPPLQYNSYNPPQQKLIQNNNLNEKKKQQRPKPKQSEGAHKKSQSLFNKKLVDLIASLQQSLGVISSNVKNSYNNDVELSNFLLSNLVQNDQKKALVESAMLAQKLAQMTSSLSNIQQQQNSSEENKRDASKKKSKDALKKKVLEKNKLLASNKTSHKTIEETSDGILSQNLSGSNRQSIDPLQGLRNNFEQYQSHSRTKSEFQQSRKAPASKTHDLPYPNSSLSSKVSQLLCNVSFPPHLAVENIQGQGGITSLTSSQSNYAQQKAEAEWKAQQCNYQQFNGGVAPASANNRKGVKENNRFKKKSANSSKNNNLSNQRGSISSKQSAKLSCERISEANALTKLKKKYPMAAHIPCSQGHSSIEHKLSSVASSPTLHSQGIYDTRKQSYVKLRVAGSSKNTIEVGVVAVRPKKSQEKQSHKRSISDANSIPKMLQFKQQMMLNKVLAKGTQSHQISINDNGSKVRANSGNRDAKGLMGSGISSKRASNEMNFQQEHRYLSPRCHVQQESSNTRESEAKNIIKKFHQNPPIPTTHQVSQNVLVKGETLSSYGGGGSTQMGSTQSTQAQKTKQNSQGYIIYNQQPAVQAEEKKNELGSGHKRARSEANLPLEVNQPAASSKVDKDLKIPRPKQVVQNYIPTMKSKEQQKGASSKNMFILNMNPIPTLQILASEQEVASVRASPATRQAYGEQEQRESSVQTNRSAKVSTIKLAPAQYSQHNRDGASNQTTLKKQTYKHGCSTPSEGGDREYQQVQHRAPPMKPKMNTLIGTCDSRKKSSFNKRGLEINTENSDDQIDSSFIQQNELVQGQIKKNLLQSSSPRLHIAPTPKAVQPGMPGEGEYRETNNNYNTVQSIESRPSEQKCDPLSVSLASQQQQEDHCPDLSGAQMETFSSNFTRTNLDQLTPRSREKHRICKLIKVSFRKFGQAPKTTPDFYRVGKMLGKGAFGRVNLAIHKLTQQLVAVKSINKVFLNEDEASQKKVMQEFIILQKLKHENVVKLFDSFQTGKHIVFSMELCAGGDLLNYVRKRRKLGEDLARHIFKQVVEGLEYCHAKRVVHRDIKLDNLLLDDKGTVKICDFGVSKHIQDVRKDVMKKQCGTPAYIAPEILKDKGYQGFGVDIWSLGVCLYAMLYGTVPFKANNMSELHAQILKAKYSLKDDKVQLSEEAKSLIRALLERDPSKRLTIQQVKTHPWLLQESEEEIQIFSEEELQSIKRDFSYQDMRRYQRNEKEEQVSTEHVFTEHELDTTQNGLVKNQSTKSQILAPFNSTVSHLEGDPRDEQGEPILPPLQIEEGMLRERRVVKFAARVKDVNRQYELNNNCELDNGVYNKFVRQSTQNDQEDDLENNGLDDRENSLLSSLNDHEKNRQNLVPQAPMASQNSDEEAEAELAKQGQDFSPLHSFLETHQCLPQVFEQELQVDDEVLEEVGEFGYPRKFVVASLEQFELNDAATCYFLLEKERKEHL